MDACITYDTLIIAKKEEAPEISCLSDAELLELNLSECTVALNNLFEALPKERKSTSLTKECVVMEAANYALELEQSLQEKENDMKDISFLKNNAETFPLRTAREDIKRPKNGFIRFAMKYRTEMATQYPNLDNRNISCLLGLQWKKMSEEERRPYEEEFKQDMKLLREKHPNWMYTPKKNREEGDFNTVVLPTRLRPKEKRKRKVLDCFEEIFPTSSRQKSKSQSGYKRRSRKKKNPIAKVKQNNNEINCLDFFDGILVDTILMPPPPNLMPPPPNLMNNELSLEMENGEWRINPLEKNRNTEYLSIDWENEILESMFEHSTHPWLQSMDQLTTVSQDDLLQHAQPFKKELM